MSVETAHDRVRTVSAPPYLVAEVEVRSTERLSPSYVRIELGGPELADFGVDGPTLDQRIKLILPSVDGHLPRTEGADDSWLARWRALPEADRGHMRTYTVREVRGGGIDTRLVLDVVLHHDEHAGPGARWAAATAFGDRVLVLAPRRGVPFGGIEFAPGRTSSLLLVADETAVPAVAAILRDLPPDARGTALLEVPDAVDVQHLPAPPGVSVTWLPRSGAEVGSRLLPAVREHVGLHDPVALDGADQVDPDLWETPTWSSAGEPLEAERLLGHDLDGVYAWIAGEAGVVTALRRALVTEVGIDRRQVAFMGYWRRGVAMRS